MIKKDHQSYQISITDEPGLNQSSLRYAVPALEKGLDIIELLANHPQGLTQTEIAQKLDRSVSEIFRMVVCLRERGYLTTQSKTERLFLSLKMFELSHRYYPMKRLLTEAIPLMTELTHRLDQSCHLAVYNRGLQLVVAQVDNPGGMGFSVRMGARIDLLKSASGFVLVACQDSAETDRRLKEYKGEVRRKDIETLRPYIEMVRENGYAEMESTQVQGVRGISFPVKTFTGNAVASISIPYLQRIGIKNCKNIFEARQILSNTADKLSLAIGGEIC